MVSVTYPFACLGYPVYVAAADTTNIIAQALIWIQINPDVSSTSSRALTRRREIIIVVSGIASFSRILKGQQLADQHLSPWSPGDLYAFRQFQQFFRRGLVWLSPQF